MDDVHRLHHWRKLATEQGYQVAEIRAVSQSFRLVYMYISEGEVIYFLSAFRKTKANNRADVKTALDRAKSQFRLWKSSRKAKARKRTR